MTDIVDGIVQLIQKAETQLPKDVVNALKRAYDIEKGIAKTQIGAIIENVQLARDTNRPMCQDTGIQTFFVKIGIESPYANQIKDLIVQAVKKATKQIPLRPNTVDTLTNENHKDNTGLHLPYITLDIVKGDKIEITSFPKGGGSENMSKLGMLKPGVGLEGVKNFVVNESMGTTFLN